MPKLLAALFVFKIKGHKEKLFVLQVHKSEYNIFLTPHELVEYSGTRENEGSHMSD